MKRFAIVLALYTSLIIGMEITDSNNNVKKIGLMFNTKDKKQVGMRITLIPTCFINDNNNNNNQILTFPFDTKTFEALKDLLEAKLQLSNIMKTDVELHEQLFALLRTRYSGMKVKDMHQLIEAGLFLKVDKLIREVCVRGYVEKKAQNKKQKKESFSEDISPLLHKWHFLCVNSDYSPETDDFSVSWNEIEFFKGTYLEQKFYHRAPFRSNSISSYISLAGFHLDSSIELKKALEKRNVMWPKVQRVDLMCNKLKEISFLPEIKESVKTLELNRNDFTSLDLAHFVQLTELNLSNNKLLAIPFLAGCSALQKLWLTHNQIKEIKEFDLLDLSNLVELQLSNNKIVTIQHQALAGCANSLKLFDLSYNPITKLDFDLPEQCMFRMVR